MLLQIVIRVTVVMMLTAIPLRADQVTIADGVYTEQQADAASSTMKSICLYLP
ncbi:MAG: hypothetical protein U5K38_17875 [Woeseiaceae bacterium]|nr:hypothetical protein [Woeseiaceae bacterium]